MANRLKSVLRDLIPYRLLRRLKISREFNTDQRLFARYAGPDDYMASKSIHPQNLEMQITKDYHRIEKGLALPEPRRPFGAAVQERLDTLLPAAATHHPDLPYVRHALVAREVLDGWNESSGAEISETLAPKGRTPREFPQAREFFSSRRSVRNYAGRPVDRALINNAVEIALQSPSVCNRQAWRIHLFDSIDNIQAALKFQNGNAGFMETIPALALITADRRMFAGANERNQPWIDGGIFAMTFVWALHAQGLGTCMLNMSQPHSTLRRLRERFEIPEHEAIVMFVSIGHPAESHRVARSPRRDVSAVARWIET